MTPLSSALEMQRRQWLRAADQMEKGGAVTDQLARWTDVEVGATHSEVVYRENKLRLHRYEPEAQKRYEVPILVVYALINRPYILDLQQDRSVVRTLLDQGFDVYLIDWGEPSQLDTSLGLSDYVERYIDNCVDVVRERSGQQAINLLGYCMGGTMSAMYAALHPEKVNALGLMASGLYFDETGGVLELWGDDEYFTPGAITETYGNVPAAFLDIGFALMDPVDNLVTKYVQLYENLENDDFVENFARMERWLSDGIDVPGTAYREFLEDVYQENKLAQDELTLDGTDVRLENLTMPILQIVGKYDHLVPEESSVPFNDLVASDDTDVIDFPTGHIGLSVSGRSHADLWPQVGSWFAERSTGDREQSDEWDLQTISGIGPAYSERLRAAGVDSIAALAASDPEALADSTDIAVSFVREWVDEAQAVADSNREHE